MTDVQCGANYATKGRGDADRGKVWELGSFCRGKRSLDCESLAGNSGRRSNVVYALRAQRIIPKTESSLLAFGVML